MARLIVITGASAGIGKATALRFAENGDKVIMVSRREEHLHNALQEITSAVPKADVSYLALDMSCPDSAPQLKDHIIATGLPLHALLCCAGAAPQIATEDLRFIVAEWQEVFTANLLTAVVSVEGTASLMTDGGSIVLYSSIAAYRGASRGTGAYGAIKSALHSYVHALATRFGSRGITVNAISPGYVAHTKFFGTALPAEREKALINQTLLGRAGEPMDIANLGFYLCSEAGSYITSQIIQINGGSNHGV